MREVTIGSQTARLSCAAVTELLYWREFHAEFGEARTAVSDLLDTERTAAQGRPDVLAALRMAWAEAATTALAEGGKMPGFERWCASLGALALGTEDGAGWVRAARDEAMAGLFLGAEASAQGE